MYNEMVTEMKAILVPVEEYGNRTSTLESALLLARKFGSYIEGIALRKNTLTMGVAEFGSVAVVDYIRDEEDWLKRARLLFERFMQYHQVPPSTETNTCLSYGWREFVPPSDTFVGVHGRVFDVTIWSAPTKDDRNSFANLETSLLNSGRPILVVPPIPMQRLGDRVMIAWNGNVGEARAIGFAIPILQKAKEVLILNTNGCSLHSPTSEQILLYLARNGIRAQISRVRLDDPDAGDEMVTIAESLECDLVIKGVQSSLKEKIFGGITRRILENPKLAVFMAH